MTRDLENDIGFKKRQSYIVNNTSTRLQVDNYFLKNLRDSALYITRPNKNDIVLKSYKRQDILQQTTVYRMEIL